MRGWRLTTILAGYLLGAPAWAAAPSAAEEHLVVAPYPGGVPWQVITDQRNSEQSMIERIPTDQNVKAIKDIIVEQEFFRQQGQDPSKFLAGLLRGLASGCHDARINGPKAGVQNGYPVAYGQAYCVGVKGEDVDSFIKVIGGKSALYVIQREMHRPTTPGATAGIRTFSKDQLDQLRTLVNAQKIAADYTVTGVQLCPAASGEGSCPQPETTASVAQTATAQAPPTAKAASPAQEDSIPPFVNGTTTVKEVRKQLGDPERENHNPDGRYVYIYRLKNVEVAAFLFGSDDVLIHARAYSRN